MSLTDDEQEELSEFRRQALLSTMQDLSEDCWAAGWYTGLERDLYRIAFERASPEYGLGWINAAERKQMRRCAILTDCWWVWCDKEHKPLKITLAEARARFQRIPSKAVPEGLRVKEAIALYRSSVAEDWELEPTVEDEAIAGKSRFHQWLNRAREVYRFQPDPALYLSRRHDGQFRLVYGTCILDVVQPSWLPSEAVRAEGCTESEPCGRIQRCAACAANSDPNDD